MIDPMSEPRSPAPNLLARLEEWWRPRRLSLVGLSFPGKALSSAALAAWLLAALVLIALGLELELPGGSDNVAPRGAEPVLVARIVTGLGYLGLACASAALVAAAPELDGRWGRSALLAVGIVGGGLGGSLVELGGIVSTYNKLIPGRELFVSGAASVVRILGVIAMIAAVAVGVAPRRWIRRWRPIAGVAAAAPFICGLAAYVYLRLAARGQVAAGLGVPHPQGLAAQAMVALVAGAGFAVGALLLWQEVVGARASRDVGLGLHRAALRWRWVVFGLLGLKLAWLALGYLDLLPSALGGDLKSWQATRDDDWLSWMMVSGMGAAVVGLLVRRPTRRRFPEREATVAAASAATGLTLFLLAATLALFIVAALGVAPESGIRRAFGDAGDWFAEGLLESQVTVVYVAGVAGLIVLFLRRWQLAAAFLVLFFVWSLPRAIDITIHGENPPPHAVGRAELASLDTAITVALLIAALTWWGRRRESSDPAALALILGASTALVYTGQLLGSVWASGAFYVGLIFPAAYRFLFEAGSLNQDAPDREGRILAIAGTTAGLLVLATVQLDSGFTGPDATSTGQLGRLLLAPPFAAVLMAISVLARRPADQSTHASAKAD